MEQHLDGDTDIAAKKRRNRSPSRPWRQLEKMTWPQATHSARFDVCQPSVTAYDMPPVGDAHGRLPISPRRRKDEVAAERRSRLVNAPLPYPRGKNVE
jgi:hypothetical protein